jgi:hypothetical protein
MRIRTKVENKTATWVINARPRVGAATSYNGFYWTNATGINAEPGTTNDWVKSGAIESGNSSGLIRVSGYAGYLVDKLGGGNPSIVEAGNFLYGTGAFYPGEYTILFSLIDNPATPADVEKVFRYNLPTLA